MLSDGFNRLGAENDLIGGIRLPVPEAEEIADLFQDLEIGHGFNAETLEYVDMVKAGIVDPAKVVRTALQNAASIASCWVL